MKKLSIILISLISIGNCYSQSNEDFEKLLSLYSQGEYTEIPNSWAKLFFNFSPNPDSNFGDKTLYVKQIVFENKNSIGLSAFSDCGAGGICQSTNLYVFDSQGQKVDSLLVFEFHFGDCADNHIQYCSFFSDSLLILVNQNTTGDCMRDTIFTNLTKIEFIHINKNGQLKRGTKHLIYENREYYYLSTDLLMDKDLKEKTKAELAIMRNEIFASHGYRFKSNKWKEYFNQMSWYEPFLENVDQLLTPIERHNIDMIIKYENK